MLVEFYIDKVRVNTHKVKALERIFSDIDHPLVYTYLDVKLLLDSRDDSKLLAILPTTKEGNFHDSHYFAEKLSEVITSGAVYISYYTDDYYTVYKITSQDIDIIRDNLTVKDLFQLFKSK